MQLLQLLVRLMGAKRCLEIGVFTGYCTLSIAQAMPPDGSIVACDIDAQATAVARQHWERAGVAGKIDLRLAPALETLDALIAEGHTGAFDFAYIDADKDNADRYYERVLRLLRVNGLMAMDNVFWGGRVAEPVPDDRTAPSIRRSTRRYAMTTASTCASIPLGDGLALARKRQDAFDGRGDP